jgi:predicted house-cleaning NTP pyrophosphatase (Maf/HAM1 superfamily)
MRRVASSARVVPCRVAFRALTRSQIEVYLEREQRMRLRGSAKSSASASRCWRESRPTIRRR